MLFNFKKKNTVHFYSLCWNDEYILKYFFRYYDNFVDRYVIFDDGSTDRTLSMLEKHAKVEIRRFERINKDSKVLSALQIQNSAWKESRGIADWVITGALDEFLYTPNLDVYLAKCKRKGITVIPALGFQMISRTLPTLNQNLLDIVKRGCPWNQMNKLSLFNPNKIVEINHSIGLHTSAPIGEVKYPVKDELLLLHYRYLSFEHTFKRNTDFQKRMGTIDKEKGWGHKYGWTKEQLKEDWDYFEKNSIEDIFSPKYNPHLMHSALSERWWRNSKSSL
jgi:glycosyltransferase involved in cell wall biosynthesis